MTHFLVLNGNLCWENLREKKGHAYVAGSGGSVLSNSGESVIGGLRGEEEYLGKSSVVVMDRQYCSL